MKLVKGQVLTTKELVAFLGISQRTWASRRDELLENFSLYFNYEVEYSGTKVNYLIVDVLGEYNPISRKKVKEKKDEVYKNAIIETVRLDSVQTPTNVGRIIKDNPEVRKLNHTEGTIKEYTRIQMKTLYGTYIGKVATPGTFGIVAEKVWCRLDAEHNMYVELTQKEIDEFFNIFSKTREEGQERDADLFSSYQEKLLTREELNNLLGKNGYSDFVKAQRIFSMRNGYCPIKVGVYMGNAFPENV